ncbi:Dabb family protein [Reichenbachiella agarivorans]|uniref:Dabb family protein n=1 Tax=Reichenbachiella agarivorans TaxID=2979464 RepID=A0ABY6CWM6_9BACT|nr:Dabb family protein [Reichenbachiella agarivorans]UXP33793.1 Dabb family protein [Reichenbachiella agarivorans]
MNKDKTKNFSHSVLFWLKEPEIATVRAKFESEAKKLIAESRYAHFSHFGVPAGTDRAVVDNSYTYSMIVTFETVADHDAYQTEDAHLHFIKECKELWTKVVIYDVLSL